MESQTKSEANFAPVVLPESRSADRRAGRGGLTAQFAAGVSVLALAIGLSNAAKAERAWQYTANTNAALTFTDNVLLQPQNEDTDFITSFTGGLQAISETRSGTVNFNYQLSYDFYIDTDELNGVRHNLLTQNNFVISDDFLFLDVDASIGERSINRSLRTPATSRTINSNQTMVLTGRVSPYIETTITDKIGITARTEYSVVDFRKAGVTNLLNPGDGDSRWAGDLNVKSLDRDQRILWETSGRVSADDDDFEQQNAAAVVRLRVGDSSKLIARGGYDKTTGRLNGLDIDDAFWRVGFEFEPLRDAFVRLEAGERYGGPSYDALVRYNLARALRFDASFVQKLQTDQNRIADALNDFITIANSPFVGIRYEDPDPVAAVAPGIVIDDELVNASTIGETARLRLAGDLGHVRYSVSGYYRTREYDLFLVSGELLEDEATGGALTLARDFGRRTAVQLNVQYVDEESNYTDADFAFLVIDSANVVDNLSTDIDSVRASLLVSYMVSPTAQASLSLTRSERDDQTGLTVEENAIMFTLTKTW